MSFSQDPDFTPLRQWCRECGIGVSTAYRLIMDGKLTITKIGVRSYVSREDREAFRKAVQDAA